MNKQLRQVLTAIFLTGMLLLPVRAGTAEDVELAKKVEELASNVQELEGLVKDLAFQLQQTQAISSIVKEVSFELKKLESSVRDLQMMDEKVEALQPRLLTLEGTIQGLAASTNEKFSMFQGRVFDLETSVQGLDARLQTVEGKIRELFALEDRVQATEQRLRELEARVAQLAQMPGRAPQKKDGKEGERLLAEVQRRIDALRMELAGQLYDLSAEVEALRAGLAALPLDELQGQIEELATQMDRNRSRITSLEVEKAEAEEIDALRARIAQMEQQLQERIEEAQAKAQTNMILAGLGIAVGLTALASIFGVF